MVKVAPCAGEISEKRGATGRSAIAGWRASNAARSCDPIALGATTKARMPRPKGVTRPPFGLKRNATIQPQLYATLQTQQTCRRDAAPRWRKCDVFLYCRINVANALIALRGLTAIGNQICRSAAKLGKCLVNSARVA